MTNLIQFLKNSENARKIFGKKEINIIEKQLNGVNLTQSEKNRLSRDIRKKFKFIKELSRFVNYFELKKGVLVKDLIEDSLDIILNDESLKNIKRIILFGSTVTGKRSFRSDVDLAVEFYQIDKRNATLFIKRMSGKLNDKVQVSVYNILPQKIKKEIDEKGRLIFDGKNKR